MLLEHPITPTTNAGMSFVMSLVCTLLMKQILKRMEWVITPRGMNLSQAIQTGPINGLIGEIECMKEIKTTLQ